MYDFDNVINRRNTDSIKWDVAENELPIWVADMDFSVAPEIAEAITERTNHPVFGYSKLCDEWYDSYINWWKRYHGISMDRNSLLFCPGVVPAISSMIRQLTSPGEKIILLTPNYNHFFYCIENNGRQVLEVEMDYDGQSYRINFERLENALRDTMACIMIVCNPQNPTGNIWDKSDLERIGQLCAKHGVTVISDEIHCDIITPGRQYIPFTSVSELNKEISITCIAPTKAFNLAGLQTSALYIPNKKLRSRISAALEKDELSMPNTFASTAAIAAFTKGRGWLDEMNEYVYKNKLIVKTFIETEIPQIKLIWGDATYLLWLDCSGLRTDSKVIASGLRKSTGLFVMAGSYYGKGGKSFLRMNVACPESVLMDGLKRLKKYIQSFSHKHRMNLNPEPFKMIKSGQKTIELRLYDKKRQSIKPGDRIEFVNTEDGNILLSKVEKLYVFKDFEDLYKNLSLLKCGYTDNNIDTANPGDMSKYYSSEQQEKYSVVGIEIKLI